MSMGTESELLSLIQSLEWYHTIDLGNGILTPGHYDHRPYLEHYQIPSSLVGKKVIDIGTASGFFAFEFERRGASVVATDLPEWFDHDFGPNYEADKTRETGKIYLHQPFEVARQALNSKVERRLINIYDLSPETVGMFDLAFCGSVLLHLTDPIKALWNIASITRETAIIATVIEREQPTRPLAAFMGHHRGDTWWIPTQACLELMAVSAGFVGVAWVSEFQLDFRDGSPGPYHGVLHAYKTLENWRAGTRHRDEVLSEYIRQDSVSIAQLQQEVQNLRAIVEMYERSRILRVANAARRFVARIRMGFSKPKYN